MFLARLLRIVLWLLLVAWIGSIARRLFTPRKPPARRPASTSNPLHRDPACGRFIPAELSHPWRDGSRTMHFCSPECRDRYRGARAQERQTGS